jgi:hypothetical protein
MCLKALAWRADSSKFVPDPRHAVRWMTSSNRVSAAAAKPVVAPIKPTASQNRAAPGLASELGICPLFFETGVGMQTHSPGLLSHSRFTHGVNSL